MFRGLSQSESQAHVYTAAACSVKHYSTKVGVILNWPFKFVVYYFTINRSYYAVPQIFWAVNSNITLCCHVTSQSL